MYTTGNGTLEDQRLDIYKNLPRDASVLEAQKPSKEGKSMPFEEISDESCRP